ncbi:MAG TPA: rhomboid family intramembrane serine protease [Phycisphaerales bacterium]|nr:rhomboid family intramembrane serine protease [Phycisphaerales bacterium]
MGIYDRQYAQTPERPSFRARMMSVTGWLIIINVTIFVLQFFLNATGLREKTGLPMITQANRMYYDKLPAGTELTVDGPYVDVDPNTVTHVISDKDTKNAHVIGATVARVIVDRKDPQKNPLGIALYEVRDAIFTLGHFSTYMGFQRLEVWRLITFQFLHGSLLHIGFNMLGLWMFGKIVEEHMGRKKYLAFYLLCGICGGLMYLILNGLGTIFVKQGWPPFPGLLINSPMAPLVGASAGVFGVIMASAYFEPDLRVQLLLPPVPMRLKLFAYCYVGLAIVMVLWGTKNAGGEAAHIGGAIAGYFFSRNSHLLLDFFDVVGDSRKPSRGPKTKAVIDKVLKPAKAEFSEKEQALFAEVDRILDKQRTEGIDKLTDAEKETLRKATELLNKKERS